MFYGFFEKESYREKLFFLYDEKRGGACKLTFPKLNGIEAPFNCLEQIIFDSLQLKASAA